ncbi:hypothetical protein GCM10009718_30550 [Isoptericola halotolerans]|uniref:Uncharacterized protein n=1 Tax=Isoptericola halotolerans TaxID=300560 RepID=A0ABX2A7N8_9MICO|nr:hypothetical protein [Isoptericola halotolerans]NOV97606.1 hypothetical protein [Isoptericola halotolerans]
MRSLLASLALGALLASGAVVATGSAATAAPSAGAPAVVQAGSVQSSIATATKPARVTIKKIGTRTAPYGGKAKIKPRVSKSGQVKVTSKTLTVKKAGKTVAKNKKTVSLKPGTYRVVTKAKYKRYTVKTTAQGTTKVWGPTKTKTLKQKLVVKQGKRPTSTAPVSKWNCPSWAPVKGNQSGIYHLPGGRYYDITTPERCFTTAAAARNAGYRASKNG